MIIKIVSVAILALGLFAGAELLTTSTDTGDPFPSCVPGQPCPPPPPPPSGD